ncbi:MAG: S-adenosylmethionine:tRNA ribosyltransferase-isomerase [Paludibacteraceae bacterium]|jgi:S-adenosylmethionine:tRNA ribosyltransferase-isomerase|nr:S-adenosylmethionine:tRNA ribosyltransferase-isomerase [Paludibacteraceae bacterium]MBP6436439.1 S-adenosylmethionine:tRNA ribosyltransferase-isomerase [Paludibacteraceae bacterium]MBP7219545.1 S-adenosylmethionine:tRNA ribosyltransferase-isomerase [Paludibacteraceae bacterium]MBP8627697.1 S-adenosylmethionine:tRNA ribosyltransferase-isomerase [Paludibacteraceae bacterium]MBP8781020.1 S-adenosylmethionine:tRNA ribosyltransferase-isomerase [Paludibacteraceae bacterium]
MNDVVKDIQISQYDYDLPDIRIAKYPLSQRDSSKLLVYKQGKIDQTVFSSISTHLPPRSLLVYNNTKVIHARLFFQKDTGAIIEIFCLEPIQPSDYQMVFQSTKRCTWKCMVGNLKKWKQGALTLVCDVKGVSIELVAERDMINSQIHIHFSWNNVGVTFGDILEAIGKLPIPPYLHRESEENDEITYQTVYSKEQGSVAAPTAGLHFTDEVLARLHQTGICTTEITLHVGAGTFLPVKSATIGEHTMHTEMVVISKQTIKHLQASIGNIIAVGTTSVRSLESLYHIGVQVSKQQYHLSVSQWEPYSDHQLLSPFEALQAVIQYLNNNGLTEIRFSTNIIILPSYQRKIVTGLITNFHQPKSTLLLLIAAFVGEDWKKMYEYALNNDFRFLSYGDSSLLLP